MCQTGRKQERAVGSRVIFNPQTIHDVTVPDFCILPLTLRGPDPFANEFGGAYDRLYRSFLTSRREVLRNGASFEEVLGGPHVDVSALDRRDGTDKTHPMTEFVIGLTRSLHYDNVTKLALMHLRHRMMRWMIYPCQETWNQLPAIMRPTSTQLQIPHPIWVDFFIVPRVRDMFIVQPDTRRLEWYTAADSIKISWDPGEKGLMEADSSTGMTRLSQASRSHFENVENITVSETAITCFPQMRGKITTRSGEVMPKMCYKSS